jgi:hypothetical protein
MKQGMVGYVVSVGDVVMLCFPMTILLSASIAKVQGTKQDMAGCAMFVKGSVWYGPCFLIRNIPFY